MITQKMTIAVAPLFLLLLIVSVEVDAQRGALKVVKTGIGVHYRGGIAAGDSIIAFGTGVNTGVDYIKPGDSKGRGIPGAERFRSTGFAVAGDRLVMIDHSEFTYHVFDAATGKTFDIPNLQNRGATSLQSSGNFVLAITLDRRTNKEGLAVIDLSGTEPVVMKLPLWQGVRRIAQASIDAVSGYIAATDGYEKVGAYLFKSGDAEPFVHDVSDTGGVSESPMAVGGDNLYYIERKSGVQSVFALNLRTGAKSKLAINLGRFLTTANGGTVAYFASRDAKDMNGTEARLVVMKKGGALTIPVPTDRFIDGSTKNNGLIGFGNRIAITPDGKYVFISGQDAIGRTEVLQYYDGTGVKLVSDSISAIKPTPVLASDVTASGSIVAFKLGTNNNTSLGYISLR